MENKAWSIKFSPETEKEWDKLAPLFQKKILNFLFKRLKTGEDPRLFAKPLTGNLKNFWRYRVGDYRLICEFQETARIIRIMRVAHRRESYNNLHLLKLSS